MQSITSGIQVDLKWKRKTLQHYAKTYDKHFGVYITILQTLLTYITEKGRSAPR